MPARVPRPPRTRCIAATVVATVCAVVVAGCSGTQTRQAPPSAVGRAGTASATVSPIVVPTSPANRTRAGDAGTPSSRLDAIPASPHRPPVSTAATPPAPGAPVIVIDPGHSRSVSGTDPRTGLNVADYENEPEMADVFAVAELVRAQLLRRGYRVVMTKTSLDQRRNLGQRADIANAAHAALALSIHDQAGSGGGIGFRNGNNIVYYQSVGNYRTTPTGSRVTFTDSEVAMLSRRYGEVFAAQRHRVQGVPITLLGNTGYNLGSRGLPAGDIWIVQLLAKVPWIYNEAGGNSAGRVGLSTADERTYADSLVAGVVRCIPPPR